MNKKIEEIWKDVVGYEGLYQVSNLGRVKSVQRHYKINGGIALRREKILKEKTSFKYKRVGLWKDSSQKFLLVHRIVATAFIPNLNNYPEINHKDENPENNCVDNLEWCTAKYNCNYLNHGKNISISRRDSGRVRKIAMIDNEGNVIKIFDAIIDAANEIGARKTDVCSVCRNRQKSVKGFKFKYID